MATTLITSATTIDISALLKDSKGVALVAGSKAYQSALTKIANFEAAVEGNRSASLTVGSTKFSYTKLATSGTTGPAITLKNGTSTFTSATTLAAGTPASTPAPTPAPTTTPTPAPTVAPTPAPTAASKALSTNADTYFGTAGTKDTFTATESTLTAGDLIADSSTTDSDTLTVSVTAGTTAAGNSTATVVGIENVAFNYASFTKTATTVNAISASTVTISNSQVGASTGVNADVTGAGGATRSWLVQALREHLPLVRRPHRH